MAIEDVEYIHPNDFQILNKMGKRYYDETTQKEFELTGIAGYVGHKVLRISVGAEERGRKWLISFINEHLINDW